jgi:protein O-mannosyl-transferase
MAVVFCVIDRPFDGLAAPGYKWMDRMSVTVPPKPASHDAWFIAALVAIVFLLFGRLATYDFSLWDDQATIHQNPLLNPPTRETFRYYWTTSDQGLYVPVTWTVWALLANVARLDTVDATRSTLNPWIYHGVNVLLHAACAVMVFGLLRRLLPGRPAWACFVGAVVFAVHPMQVESVGWISGMKDLLCWTFFLLALRSYVSLAQRDAAETARSIGQALLDRRLVLTLLWLSLAALSKPTAFVFPAAALIVDALLIRRPVRRIAMTLAPVALVAAVFAVVARVAQTTDYQASAPLWARPFIAFDSLAFYAWKLVWPAELAIDYMRTPTAVLASGYWWATALVTLVLATAFAVLYRVTRNPVFIAAPALFVVGVLPVLGLATFMMQVYSTVTDHYVYFSMTGVALLTADLLSRVHGAGGRVAVRGAAVVCIALAVRTWIAVPAWQNTETLFLNVERVSPNSWVAQNNLGSYYNDLRRFDEAMPRFERSIQLNPNNTLPHLNVAMIHLMQGDDARARESLRQMELAVERAPRVDNTLRAHAQYQIGEAYMKAGLWEDALRHIDRGLQLLPGHAMLIDLRKKVVQARDLQAARAAATKPS